MTRFFSALDIHIHTRKILILSVTIFVILGGLTRSQVAKISFVNNYIGVFFCLVINLLHSLVPSPNYLCKVTVLVC